MTSVGVREIGSTEAKNYGDEKTTPWSMKICINPTPILFQSQQTPKILCNWGLNFCWSLYLQPRLDRLEIS